MQQPETTTYVGIYITAADECFHYQGGDCSFKCANCVSMEFQLQNVLIELKSAHKIITLLQSDINNLISLNSTGVNDVFPVSELHNSKYADGGWIPVVQSNNKKPNKPFKPVASYNCANITVSNKFTPLYNKHAETMKRIKDACL
jgi:hypothetical protein